MGRGVTIVLGFSGGADALVRAGPLVQIPKVDKMKADEASAAVQGDRPTLDIPYENRPR